MYLLRHLLWSFLTLPRRGWEALAWARRNYAPPSPRHIKRAVLIRNGGASLTWVETGTYMADTTRFLAQHASRVISIEPDKHLYSLASSRLRGLPHVQIYHGTSESILPAIMPLLTGSVSFWLDGHYSGGRTFEGPQVTPIRDELRIIEAHLNRLTEVVVLIDDVRCFDPTQAAYVTYPDLAYLVQWATRNHLKWHIEHDIFVAQGWKG